MAAAERTASGYARLRGAVDLHIHTGPDIFPRCVTAQSAAEAARDAGMAAIVVKSHSTDTSARAETASQATGFPVYGGVVLNHSVGGLNPYAVLETVRQGGRVVWMPTIGSRQFIQNSHHSPMISKGIPPGVRGLTATAGGRVKPAVLRILDLIAAHDLLLASGHLSPDETIAVFEEARARGITRLYVNHPNAKFITMGVEAMTRLAELGAFLEFTPQGTATERLAAIRAVGAHNCFFATDGGSTSAPPPVARLTAMVQEFTDLGLTGAEITHMTVSVPSYLLGLEGFEERPTLR